MFPKCSRIGTEEIVHAPTGATPPSPTYNIYALDGAGAYDTMPQPDLASPLSTCFIPKHPIWYGTMSQTHDEKL